MKISLLPVKVCSLILLGIAPCFAAENANQLSQEEKAGKWTLLFDGKTTAGWHSFRKTTFPNKGWEVEGEWLHCLGKGGGDIVSEGLFAQFELAWDWKIAARGNSGVKYFVTDSRSSALGHEYQMYDEPERKGQPPAKHDTGSFYDVLKPLVKPPVRPVGEINTSRILVKGNHVEHWLNGIKVLEYDCNSDEVKAAVAASKFKTTPGFGSCLEGHILLQDHGSEVWFRNIKIRSTGPGQ